MSQEIRVTALDHVVLNCADVERSLRFYVDELGLEPIHVEEWRRGERFFPSVRVSAETILDLVIREAGRAAGLPRWESGVITFFLALPIDLVITSAMHSGLMGIKFGKGIEVWFVQRLIQLSIVAAIVFVVALVILVQNGN